jgi:lipopolysaccharide export system protein LptC
MWQQRHAPARTAGPARPDYTLHDFTMVALDKQGRESMTLAAPYLERDPGNHEYHITTPRMRFPDGKGAAWTGQAARGWVNADYSQARLDGDVRFDSPPGVGQPTTFRTSTLSLWPRQHLARSQARVVATSPGSILSGVGFEARLDRREYSLLSNVRARYAPISR